MERKLIGKMIQNCFKQYYPDGESLPVNKEEMEKLCIRIVERKNAEANIDLYEIVNDVVYEFVTG